MRTSKACPRGAIFSLTWLFAALLLGFMEDGHAEEQEAHAGTLEDWEFYGSVRMEGAYWKRYKWYEYYQDLNNDPDGDGIVDSLFVLDTLPVTKLRMGLQNNSYFGARARGEKFGFGFELGLTNFLSGASLFGIGWDDYNLTLNSRRSTFLRKIYGDWYLNDNLTVRIGQDWNLTNFFLSNQVYNSDAGLGYSGILFTGRSPQLKFSANYPLDKIALKAEAAAIKQHANLLPGESFSPTVGTGYLQRTEEKMPKFEGNGEVGYKFSDLLSAHVRVAGGFTQYDAVLYVEEDPENLDSIGDVRATIKSNIVGAYLDLRVWKFGLALTYAQGKNPASYGVWMGNPDVSLGDQSMRMFFPAYRYLDSLSGDVVLNAKVKQGAAVLSFRALPWLTWEAGGGIVEADHEDKEIIKGILILNAFKRIAYYSNLQITVADGHFLIVPEFSFSDFAGFKKSLRDGNEPGGFLYSYGIKLELDI